MRWKDVTECDIFLVVPLWSKWQQPVVQQRTISATSIKLQNWDISQVTYLNIKLTFKTSQVLPSVCFETSEASKTAGVGNRLVSPKWRQCVHVYCPVRLMLFWSPFVMVGPCNPLGRFLVEILVEIWWISFWWKEILVWLPVPCLFSLLINVIF